MLKKLIVLASCVLIATGVGCANIESKGQTVRLQDRTRAYRKAIRWSEFEVANSFIVRSDASTHTYDPAFHKGIKVTSVEITEHDIRLEDEEAYVTIELSFYHEAGGVVEDIIDKQRWWYDPEAEQWYLDGSFPDFAGSL